MIFVKKRKFKTRLQAQQCVGILEEIGSTKVKTASNSTKHLIKIFYSSFISVVVENRTMVCIIFDHKVFAKFKVLKLPLTDFCHKESASAAELEM